jgi:hypothetical protein
MPRVKRMHICGEWCDRHGVRWAHERARVLRRQAVKAKLHGKRPKVRATTIRWGF